MQQPKKGLILAGGGARGSYQVGVWRALCELGWRPDIITGTSVGSLNGAMFVLDAADTALSMWLSIRSEDVLQLPEDEPSPSELHLFLRDTVRAGGLNAAPLEEIIDRVLDEDALRASPIAFGLVTVSLRGLRRKQLPLREIPQGKVKDYLLASAACFPAIRPREIEGELYLDGGYQDVMPHQLAIQMGAEELVCVNLDGMGITRKNKLKENTILIESRWDLGELLRFDPVQAKRNVNVGYYDTLRAFGKLRGTAYAIAHASDAEVAWFRVRYDTLLLQAIKHTPTLAIREFAAIQFFSPLDKPLAPLEIAAKYASVCPETLYHIETLSQAFLDAYDPRQAERFAGALLGSAPEGIGIATATPTEWVAALVYYTLTKNLTELEGFA